jgi:ABC-type glycerol-3-phosphate transport system substrate-binding protein
VGLGRGEDGKPEGEAARRDRGPREEQAGKHKEEGAVDRSDDLTTMLKNGLIGRREFLQRAMALGLSLPAAGALLAACGGGGGGGEAAPPPAPPAETGGASAGGTSGAPDLEGVTISFGKAPHGEKEIDLFKQWLAPFEEATGAKVEHTVVPWDQLEAQYTAAFSGDKPFDVTYQVSTHLTLFGTRGYFEDLTNWITRPDFKDYTDNTPQAIIDPSIYQGKLYGAPFIIGTIVMFANQDMIEGAGLAVPTTTDELITVGKALTTSDVWGFYTPTTVKDFGWYFNLQNVHNAGGDIVSDDLASATINSQPVIDATQWATDIIQTHKIQPPVGAYDREGGIELFKAGKLALILDEPLRTVPFQEAKLPFKWDIYLPVGWPGGGQTTFSTTGHWVMAAKSKNKDAAWELIKFLSSHDFSLEYNLEYGFVPVRGDVDVSGGDPLLAKNAGWAQNNWDGLVTTPKISQLLDEYVKALEAATSGSSAVADALNEAQKRAEDILAQA